MKFWIQFVLLVVFSTGLYGQEDESETAYEDLAGWESVSEIMRHLYRWYLDDADLHKVSQEKSVVCYVTPLSPELDEGDLSLYADVYFPAIGTVVSMKRTDYEIEELSLEVASDSFKIVNVERVEGEYPLSDQVIRSEFPYEEMWEHLFQTRHQQDPPTADLLNRLREAARGQLAKRIDAASNDATHQTVFISPISPVANEIWAYWQEAQLLLRWNTDIDIAHPSVWEHEHLMVDVFDIEKQVVLSFSHVPGSNAYLTRDHVGRILYNCSVLGQRVVIER